MICGRSYMSWHACKHAADADMYLLQSCGWHCIALSMIPWCMFSLNATGKLTSSFLQLTILTSVFLVHAKPLFIRRFSISVKAKTRKSQMCKK